MKKLIFVSHTDYNGENAKVLESLRADYGVVLSPHITEVRRAFDVGGRLRDERFDFLITNLPKREDEASFGFEFDKMNNSQREYFMRAFVYYPALHALRRIGQARAEMRVLVYSGAPRFILEGCLKEMIADYAIPRPDYFSSFENEIDFLKKCIEGEIMPGRPI